MAQLTQLNQQASDIRQLFTLNHQRMIRTVPKGFDPNRLLSVAFNSICYNTDLLLCTRESLIGGTLESLKLGLTLGGPMQEAWLIPFNNRRQIKGQWETVKEATLIIGYMGFRNLIDRARAVTALHPRAVSNGMVAGAIDSKTKRPTSFAPGNPDEFDYWFGAEPNIIHRPKNSMPEFKEQLRAVYCVANLRGGGRQLEVMEIEEIEKHRNRSRAKDSGPWVSDYVPMALKTSIRKMAKYLPKASIELSRALDLDDRADSGEPQDYTIDGLVIPEKDPVAVAGADAPPTRQLEGLKDKLGAKARKGQPTDADLPLPAVPVEDINFGS